jgi:hypothetical protein
MLVMTCDATGQTIRKLSQRFARRVHAGNSVILKCRKNANKRGTPFKYVKKLLKKLSERKQKAASIVLLSVLGEDETSWAWKRGKN